MYTLWIVDDEPYIYDGLVRMLDAEELGLTVAPPVYGAREALEKMEALPPDILIADIHMPGMDGIELLEAARARYPRLRALVLSGYDDFEYVRRAAVLGIDNYLLKPVNLDELNETLSNILRALHEEEHRRVFEHADRFRLRDNILHLILSGSIDPFSLRDKLSLVGLKRYATQYAVLLFRFPDADMTQVGEACRRLDGWLAALGEGVALRVSESDVVEIRVWGGVPDEPREDALRQLERLQAETGLSARVFASAPERNPRALHLRYAELLKSASPERSAPYNPNVEAVKAHVAAHYAEGLSLQTIADEMGLSPAYLGQLFARETGQSFSVYLNEYRVARALPLLQSPDARLADIARDVGYTSLSYFVMIFKKVMGKSPSEYRIR